MPLHALAHRCRLGLGRSLVLLAGLGAATVLAQGGGVPSSAAPEPKRVVILMGSDPSLPALRLFDDAFRKSLQAATPAGITFFTDTLDAQRFSYAAIAPEFLALERKKYAAQRVDLVVGIAEGAADFIRDHGPALWPDAPVLLSGLDDDRTDRSKLAPGADVQFWRLDIDGTLALIETLQPNAKRMVIIGGTADYDRNLTARVVERANNRARWQVEVWDRYAVEEALSRVAALDRSTAVIFATMLRDGQGRAGFSVDVLSRIAANSRAPIYGLYGTYIGRGAVAGKVVDFPELGRRAGQQAAALLGDRKSVV